LSHPWYGSSPLAGFLIPFSTMNYAKAVSKFLAILVLGFFTGCTPAPLSRTAPGPEWLYIQIPDSLLSLSNEYKSCTPSGTGLAILSPFDAGEPQIILRWGDTQTENYHAYQIGEEQLVLIVNPNNPIAHVRYEDIQKVYFGKMPSLNWESLGGSNLTLTLAGYPVESDITRRFLQIIDQQNPTFSLEMVIIPSPQEMRTFIANTPGGLGMLPKRWVDDSIRPLSVEGQIGTDKFPILALTPAEPQGKTLEWLLCIQERLAEVP